MFFALQKILEVGKSRLPNQRKNVRNRQCEQNLKRLKPIFCQMKTLWLEVLWWKTMVSHNRKGTKDPWQSLLTKWKVLERHSHFVFKQVFQIWRGVSEYSDRFSMETKDWVPLSGNIYLMTFMQLLIPDPICTIWNSNGFHRTEKAHSLLLEFTSNWRIT